MPPSKLIVKNICSPKVLFIRGVNYEGGRSNPKSSFMRGLIVPPSKLIVKQNSPQRVFFIRGRLLLRGGDYSIYLPAYLRFPTFYPCRYQVKMLEGLHRSCLGVTLAYLYISISLYIYISVSLIHLSLSLSLSLYIYIYIYIYLDRLGTEASATDVVGAATAPRLSYLQHVERMHTRPCMSLQMYSSNYVCTHVSGIR